MSTADIRPPDVRLAVDAMGGDGGPPVVVQGLNEAARLHPTAHFLLFGDPAVLAPHLEAHPRLTSQVTVREAASTVPSGLKPRNALRADYERSSLALTLEAVANGEASACISAADTGAMMALGMRHLGLFSGIDRPAVASYVPTLRNETVVLDLGANLSVAGKNLLQFGILGTALSETMLAIPEPRVGLLNIGSEETKGPAHIQDAHELMRAHAWAGSYMGFVEPNDLIHGKMDVMVCDGYAGNIFLKSTEATAALVGGYTQATFNESWLSRLGLIFAARQFAKLRQRIDPRRYNGAVMAGLANVCVKSHGGADPISFANALELAIDMVNGGYTRRVPELLETELQQSTSR